MLVHVDEQTDKQLRVVERKFKTFLVVVLSCLVCELVGFKLLRLVLWTSSTATRVCTQNTVIVMVVA